MSSEKQGIRSLSIDTQKEVRRNVYKLLEKGWKAAVKVSPLIAASFIFLLFSGDYLIRETPVISSGFSILSKPRIVGAMSAKMPSLNSTEPESSPT